MEIITLKKRNTVSENLETCSRLGDLMGNFPRKCHMNGGHWGSGGRRKGKLGG